MATATASVRKLDVLQDAVDLDATAVADESTDTFISVDELQKMGINAADIAKLKSSGLSTVGLILATPSKRLLEIKGISDAKLEKITEAAKKLKPTGFLTGTEALVQSKSRMHVTSGSKELDAILGGGFETGAVTELFGEFRCGKTQLCASLCVTSQLGREHGGGAGKVIVIDTENAFRIERVAEIAEKRYGLDPSAVLDNIIVGRALTHEHQCELLATAMAKIAEDEEPYRLVIIDSIMGLFRVEFSGRGELAERQQKLGLHIRELVKTAAEFNVAVVLTNQITADPGNMFVPDAKKPVGGNILAHYVTTRVYLRKGKANQRIAKIYSGPLPELEATFAITEKGVEDGE